MEYPGRTSNIVGQGRRDYNLPYRSGRDIPKSLPFAPISIDVTSPYIIGVIDIRWDNPAVIPQNNGVSVTGVNVYRSFDNPEGPYTKLNTTPVSNLSYRDETSEIRVDREDAMASLRPGTGPTGEWIICVQNGPIVIPGSNGRENTLDVRDVHVEVDPDGSGYQSVCVFKVNGDSGEIVLNSNRMYDQATNTYINPILPDPLTGGVRVTYSYVNEAVESNLHKKIYYKATTVAVDGNGTEIETPLNEVEEKSLYDIENVDWVWAEAIRRNRWLLEQTGERVKIFLRKWNGIQCECYNGDYGYAKNSSNMCTTCYGTRFEGGYVGPIDGMIAPPETEKQVSLQDFGLHVIYDWATWTGPFPLLNDRDVIVRQNNDRFFINNVNYQGSRGAVYQQHFSLAQVDSKDPVYAIPINGGATEIPAGWDRYRDPDAPSDASPVLTTKPDLDPGTTRKGRTVTFENIMY